MTSSGDVPWRGRMGLWFESVFMSVLVPKESAGPILKWLFRLPLFFWRARLGFLIPGNILILTTKGRRTGKPHSTPLEFGPGQRKGSVVIMAGWGGNTDWHRNLLQDPCVRVWMHGKEMEAVVERLPDTEVAAMLRSLAQASPAANRIWSRFAGFDVDGSDASYLAAAPHFPAFSLQPTRAGTG